MKLKEYQATSKNSDFIITKFLENPGKFASIVLRMYWNAEKERDAYKSERDTLIDDIADLRKQRDELKRKLDDVVSMVNAYIIATKAYSGDGAYNLLENELNRILEDE